MKSIIFIIICLFLFSCNRSFKDENDVKTWLSGKEFSSENPDYNTFTLAGETVRHNEKLTIAFDGDKVQYKDCTPTPYVVTKNEGDDDYEVSFPVDCIENSYFTIILRNNGKILTKSVVYDANYAYNRTEYADNRPNAIAKLDYLVHLTRDEVSGPQLEVTNENIRITRPIILADTQMTKMADTTKIIKTDTVPKLKVQEMQPIGDDTTSLIVQTHTEKGDYYIISNKLPLSYRYQNTKFTFRKGEYGNMIRLDCYNETGLYSTVYCLHQGIFLYVNRGMEDIFTCAGGEVKWNHQNTEVQLYEVKTTNDNTTKSSITIPVSSQQSQYVVSTPVAYFYDNPGDPQSMRKAYLVNGENIISLKDSINFVYCEFTDSTTKKTTKGWISKNCLK